MRRLHRRPTPGSKTCLRRRQAHARWRGRGRSMDENKPAVGVRGGRVRRAEGDRFGFGGAERGAGPIGEDRRVELRGFESLDWGRKDRRTSCVRPTLVRGGNEGRRSRGPGGLDRDGEPARGRLTALARSPTRSSAKGSSASNRSSRRHHRLVDSRPSAAGSPLKPSPSD